MVLSGWWSGVFIQCSYVCSHHLLWVDDCGTVVLFEQESLARLLWWEVPGFEVGSLPPQWLVEVEMVLWCLHILTCTDITWNSEPIDTTDVLWNGSRVEFFFPSKVINICIYVISSKSNTIHVYLTQKGTTAWNFERIGTIRVLWNSSYQGKRRKWPLFCLGTRKNWIHTDTVLRHHTNTKRLYFDFLFNTYN